MSEGSYLTVEQRIETWNAFCTRFYQDLTHRPGHLLTAAWRLAIYVAAQEALLCEGCLATENACLRPGAAFEFLSKLDHQLVLKGLDDEPEEVKTIVRNLIVTIINHQTKVDEKWYEATMEALDKQTKFIPSDISGEHRRGMLATLFAEILGVTIVSHGIGLVYRAMDKSPPPMPSIDDVQEQALQPIMFNIANSLKKGKTLRMEKQGAGWAPLVEYGDLDASAIEELFTTPEEQTFAKDRMASFIPGAVLNMSPHGLLIEEDFFNVFAYHYNGFHGGVFLGASKPSGDIDPERKELLIELGTAVATRPFDLERFNTACRSVKESLGEGPLMEAIGMAAALDGQTRCADLSGKELPPAAVTGAMSFVLRSINSTVS